MKSIEFERRFRLSQHGTFQDTLLSSLQSQLHDHPLIGPNIFPILDICLSIDYNHIGMSSSAYMNHPLRVALLAINEVPAPSFNLLATSLLHNIKELSVDTFHNLVGIPDPVLNAISLLTVDRNDLTSAYKDHYYSQLATIPFVAQVKILDKLDNLFLLCLNPSAKVRADYLCEIENYLYPMISQFLPHLYDYFVELVADAHSLGHVLI